MAISHLRIGKEIGNVDTERSEEANAIRRFFDVAREKVLRDFRWPFATKFVALGLVEEDPTTEWQYSYRYPSDCLLIRRVISGTRNDSRNSRIPYIVTQDDAGWLIYTDRQDAEIEYTKNETITSMWPADFVTAFSYYLASLAAPRLTAGDPFNLQAKVLQMYDFELATARSAALNEQQPDQERASDAELARESLDTTGDPDDWEAFPSAGTITT
jgi:hypothetical protein